MTTTINKEQKNPNVPNKQEHNQTCLSSAERDGLRPKGNVPNLRFPEFEGEWEKCKLGDASEFSKERVNTQNLSSDNYVATENMLQDYQGFIEASSVPTNTNVVKFNKGDVLLSNIRPYLKKVWFADKNGGCSADVFVFKALSACIPDFLHYIIANDRFINFAMSGAKGVKMPRGDKEQMKTYEIGLPSIEEQKKIATLLQLLDERIATQNKIIEDLKKLKCAIIETEYNGKGHEYRIGDIIDQVSQRNKRCLVNTVLSVNNKLGFINQDEQFEDRTVASEDTSNYKVVFKDDFAYNPARINVGSIARLKSFDKGIVSPMYICFKVTDGIVPEYLESYFATNHFFKEMQKRLEGSVRLCLSFEGLCNIPIFVPCIDEQTEIGKRIYQLENKIKTECNILSLYEKQKQYLLRQMFI